MIVAGETELIGLIKKAMIEVLKEHKQGPKYYTLAEARDILKVSESTLLKWRKPNDRGEVKLVASRISGKLLISDEEIQRLVASGYRN